MMDQLDIFLAGLKKDMKTKGLTQAELAKTSGLCFATVNNVLNGKQGNMVTLKILVKCINSHPDKKK